MMVVVVLSVTMSACTPHSVREAEKVVTQADSLWQAGLLPSTLFGQQYIHFPNPQKEY